MVYVNEDIEDCDYWVVYEGMTKQETVRCPIENTIFITGEPPTVKSYSPAFLAQFSKVITSHRTLLHKNLLYYQQAQPWHVGRRIREGFSINFSKDYDELSLIQEFNKKKLISVMSSSKTFTQGHLDRINFVIKLLESYANQIDFYGMGFNDIEDKWDAISPYKYHVVIENARVEDYWTEKLADCYLGGAFPIYYGCPNISQYFPSDSYAEIDILDPLQAFKTIEEVVSGSYYEKNKDAVLEARDLVLNKYNLFAMLDELCSARTGSSVKREVTIYPY